MAFQKLPSVSFNTKVTNFPESAYGVFNRNTRLHKLMWALLEIGLGQLDNLQLAAEVGQQSMSGTSFSELDEFFSFLGISRLPSEAYSYDAMRNPLTLSQWQDVIAKDSAFRMRILKFMQSLTRGGTVEGIEMAAYAASGVRCKILEMWRVSSGSVINIPQWNGYRPDKNFLIVPTESITEEQKLTIIHLVDIIKPVDTVCSVLNDPLALKKFVEVSIRWVGASNHYYTITRQISVDSTQFSTQDMSIVPTATGGEAPTYAYMDTMEQEWDLSSTINSARATILSPYYTIDYAILDSDSYVQGDKSDTIVVRISDFLKTPNSPVFNIKIDDEIMIIINKKTIADNKFEYTVLRGQDGTAAEVHSSLSKVSTNAMVIETVIPIAGGQQTYWKDIPDTPSDITEDINGNPINIWSSRSEYVKWFTGQIIKLGGQVSGNQYRFPLEFATSPNDEEFRAEDAIAEPSLDVITVVLPGANV